MGTPEPVDSLAPHIHRVRARASYCTSVWLDLARHHERWAARLTTRIVLCDTDPRTGRSQAALLPRT